jgi:TetR/AcrR family transcriptional repressor of nem operon
LELRTEKRRRGRPPKTKAGHSDTRQALLKAGVAALTEKGFSATGIDEILRKIDVPKGYFSTKLDRILLNESQSPLQRLQDFFDDAERGMKRYKFARGCLVGNLGQEMGALPPAYRSLLIEVFHDWEAKTSACLKEAVKEGEISSSIDCDKTAEFFWIGWEGAVLRAKLEKSERPLRVFSQGFIAGIT